MKKLAAWFTLAVMLCFLGCTQQQKVGPDDAASVQTRSLLEQQLAAYPMLGENAYLSLADFEDPEQIGDFALTFAGVRPRDKSKLSYSGSPTATGGGALGVYFDTLGDYRLSFNSPIQKWTGFNLLLCSIYVGDPKMTCEITFLDAAGKSAKKHFSLENGWNKLKIDLQSLSQAIDLNNVLRLQFDFDQVGATRIFLDDLILVNYHRTLLGEVDGPAGSLYALQDGKRISIGVNNRFEVVFSSGKMIAWYDLESDKKRINNLLPASALGVEIFQNAGHPTASRPAGTEVTVHSRLTVRSEKEIELRVEHYFDAYTMKLGPDEVLTYRIHPDGEILLDLSIRNAGEHMGVGFTVAGDQGFDPVIGKIRNPEAGTNARVEYALLRRMGKKAGADFLMALPPWKDRSQAVFCKTEKTKSGDLRMVFTSPTRPGENTVHGLIRLWPTKIDHLGNAEKYVREIFEKRMMETR